ncbi:hypothetical protein [Spiribacter vilamensis]|uniref:Sulfotransferase domain-containing protein n=1 Tax=Spiribacter vilamensis TaxID=531306 RepID=A0A4Q8D2N5_9GAMM|nr:hypothetical protein [Spiribacter vilamensis]RZU99604.1 hypothetical protein EV698_1897 [Spiribacter vilamensis]TVO61434.1 hypothetical protein FPL09_04750 [Spiribacter vilamensis]
MTILKRTTAPLLQMASCIGNRIYPYRNENALLISGSPRGGTTWIAESIGNAIGRYRSLWEPLQGGNISKLNLGFSKRPFLDDNSVTSDQKNFFHTLVNAQQANSHLLRLREKPSNIFHLFTNGRLIIKFVRGNGVVALISEKFELPKPLIIIRHPCAVISSQMHMGSWEDHPHIDDNLVLKYPHLSDVVDSKAPLEERLAMTWAADVVAAKANSSRVNIVFYEDVVLKGSEALAPAFESWGWTKPPENLEQILGRPSSTTHAWSTLDDLESKIGRWRKDLDTESVRRVLSVCYAMGVKDYGESVWPQTQNDA